MLPASAAPSSLRDAHLINAVLTLGYVLPLYFAKSTRLSFAKTPENKGTRSKGSSERWRDDPAVIKARLLSVSLSTIASLCLMGYIITAGPSKPLEVSKRLTESRSVLLMYLPESVGYSCPASRILFGQVRSPRLLRDTSSVPRSSVWSVPKSRSAFHGTEKYPRLGRNSELYRRKCHSSESLRAFQTICVFKQGPISEELVWRSCIITAYRLAGASNTCLVFFTPLSFGSGELFYHCSGINSILY